MKKEFTITKDEDGTRLDRWVRRHYPDVSQGLLEKLLRKGALKLDGKKAKSSDRVQAGQVVALFGDAWADAKKPEKVAPMKVAPEDARDLQQSVLFKNDYLIVINKPPGLAVQGGSGQTKHLDGMLDAIRFESKERPKLVHRLDRDTSGVLMLARSTRAASELMHALQQKNIRKVYWALVMGVPHPLEGTIDGALLKKANEGGKEKMELDEDGQHAITHYEVKDSLKKKLSWLEMEPVTGRTHQLRVHAAAMGHPIVGDGKYGGREAFVEGIQLPRQLHLHARRLEIPAMFGQKKIVVEAPLPKHMKESWKLLGLAE